MTTRERITTVLAMCLLLPGTHASAAATSMDAVRSGRPWIPAATDLATVDGKQVLEDSLSYHFVPDESVPGQWVVVDLVVDTYAFRPDQQIWQENVFDLVEARFNANGSVALSFTGEDRTDTWTRGHVLHDGRLRTDSSYTLVAIGDELYMFLQWKSEDYSLRFQRPPFWVLRKL